MREHYLIDTDVLYDHLVHNNKKKRSFLTQLMMQGECFTTVLNASELFFFAKNDEHKMAIKKLLYALKVLGLNSRYSMDVPNYSDKFSSYQECLFYIIAEKNNLTIATNSPEKYNFGKVKILSEKKTKRKSGK
uniref:PIN domain-containing protein n=1 Tax=Ignavibacterium album TaxID=591197 RepID=A0A7V2ZL01_9BACT